MPYQSVQSDTEVLFSLLTFITLYWLHWYIVSLVDVHLRVILENISLPGAGDKIRWKP